VQFRALYSAAVGQFEVAVAQTQALLDTLQLPEAAGHRAAWERGYQHGLARILWMAGDRAGFEALAPVLMAPRRPSEWPFIDAASAFIRGLSALSKGNPAAAEEPLKQAVQAHARFRMPMVHGDPRIALAQCRLAQNRRTPAWEAFEPVYREVLEENAVGLLLLERRSVVRELLDLAPPATRRGSGHAELLRALESWNDACRDEPVAAAGPLQRLSDREIEVLAQVAAGASNKHIARDLELSLHTVKRHIANILDKLDCGSRGQAADLFRRHAPAN